jgi:hypothetical protein
MTLPLLAAAAAAMLQGCGSAPDTEFKRPRTSLAVQKGDSDQCWKAAQKNNLNDEEAAGNVVAGYFVGGLVGAMIASSANEEARKDPKSYTRRKAHDECMGQRGYKKVE